MSFANALNWRSPAAVALFSMLALTGCAAGADDEPIAESNPSPSESGSAAATAEAEPSEEPPPSAADGTDYSNCDTRCEVEVTDGVVFEYEAFTMTITDVTEDGIEISRDDGAGSTGSASISGGYCVAYMSANGSGSTCYGMVEGEPPAPEPAEGEVALELMHVADGTAIIRLTVG